MRVRALANAVLLAGAALFVTMAMGARAASADWPRWRGPERTGVVRRSPRLVSRFSATALAWRSGGWPSGERGGRGSLAVVGEQVYGLTRLGGGSGRDHVFCLDLADGTTRWKTPLSGKVEGPASSSTPCVVGGRLYVAASTSRIHCLDAESGRELWSRPLSRSGTESGKAVKGIASSIVTSDGVGALLANGLVAFDTSDGRVLWRNEEIEGFQSSPTFYRRPDGTSTIVVNSRLETWCLEMRSGKVLWRVPGGGLSTPAVHSEYGGDFLVVLARSRRNGLSAYRIDGESPRKLWTIRVHDRGASPIVSDGHVYAIAGGSNGHGARALCVHLDSGTIAWDETIDFAEVSSPVLADGKLFAVCGTMVRVIAATPEQFSDFGATEAGVTLCTSPAVSRGRLLLRQGDGVACYDLREP